MRASMMAVILLWATWAHGATYYVSPGGGGDGSSCVSAKTVSATWASIVAGDTIKMCDGTYTGDAGMVNPPDTLTGTEIAPIVIEAINEGSVFLDGAGARVSVAFVGGNNWFTVRGINACCSNGAVVNIYQASNIRIERVVAWDAAVGTANATVFNITGTGHRLIDVAGFGKGRKALGRISDTNAVVLRGFFMKTRGPDNDDGMAATWAYKTVNGLMLNVIAVTDLDGLGLLQDSSVLGPDHYEYNPDHPLGAVSVTVKGSIAYHNDGQGIATIPVLFGLSMNPANLDPGTVVTVTSDNNLAMRRAAALPPTGIKWFPNVSPSLYVTNHWTNSVGTLAAGTHLRSTASQDVTGTAAAISAFNNGLLQLDATTQPANGAWLRYTYDETGALTAVPLWPWAMEKRIADAMGTTSYNVRGIDGAGSKSITDTILRLSGSVLTGWRQSGFLAFF